MILEKLDFCLRTHLLEVGAAFADKTRLRELDLVLDLDGLGNAQVSGDPGGLRQIMVNLIGNAIKFTEQGEIAITAKLALQSSGRLRFDCAVSDTGAGMLEAECARLRKALEHPDTSHEQQYGGSGLGLAISQKLCLMMEGEIQIESEIGRGSTFSFFILLDSAEQELLEIPHVDLSHISVLVVDDDVQNTQVLRRELETWGAKVFAVSNGATALGFLEEQCIARETLVDIAFMDSQLPGMDGARLGKIIRSDERYKDIKLVMMASMSTRGDARTLARLGFDAYFPKPAAALDLYHAISILIEGGKVRENANPLVTHHYLRDLHHALDSQNIAKDLHRLLLVEDNLINQEVALGLVEDMGLTADVANNGHEALACLVNPPNQKPYSLVLMDCQMPIMDGYEATRKIRSGEAGEANRNIPIVAMTANAMKGDRAICLDSGMSDYIAKPVNPDELERILGNWLNANCSKLVHSGDNGALDPVWDKSSALRRLRGKEDRLRRIVKLFMDDMPGQMQRLQIAIESENLRAAKDIAHLIKGVAGNLSGIELTQVAGDIQKACEEDELAQVKVLSRRMVERFSNLEQRLKDYSSIRH